MKRFLAVQLITLLVGMVGMANAVTPEENLPWSQQAANATIKRWPDGRFVQAGSRWTWNYELGTLLEGMDAVWLNTANPQYYNYIKISIDQFVGPDGSIPTFKPEENQLDSILLGRQLLLLYGVTQDPRYAKAASLLYEQLQHQPRTASGGFWHKQRYPNQMWLDGLYMAEPFYAEYASTFHHSEDFKDITHQFMLLNEHARDKKTGLLYHGWDESRQERWADKKTGLSSQFWARGMGWHMMALVDTLAYYPEQDPGRKQLIVQLQQDASAVAHYQDSETGLWFQVIDKAGEKGNYLESSASCMFVYSLAKGVREGYLPSSYLANANRGYQGILKHFVQAGQDGMLSLSGTVKGVGLGGDPYRDGSYAYYIGEKQTTDDPKGVGTFLLASVEIENSLDAKMGRGKTVLLDGWFNSQKRQDAFGQLVAHHYKWGDQSENGYSLLGHIFNNFGAETNMLDVAPTQEALGDAQVYIIVSPDTPAKNPKPHFVQSEDSVAIAKWVKNGGVLMIFANDPENTDLKGLNLIADQFGFRFNTVLRKHVVGHSYELGKLVISGDSAVFQSPHTAFMKDTCNISLSPPAFALFQDEEGVLMASARYGKGTVFATVDPWLYNEYTDGRKLPGIFDNYAAGKELVRWILSQIPRQNRNSTDARSSH